MGFDIEQFNTPAKRLEFLGKFEGLWKWVWYLGLGAFGIVLAVNVFPYIITGLDNTAGLIQSLLWLGMWVVALVAYLYVVTHRGLRQFLLRAFDHLVYAMDRGLRKHDPFTDAQISIDRLKKRSLEVKQGCVNVDGARKKITAKAKLFEEKAEQALASAEVARERNNIAQVNRFARLADKYKNAVGRLTPQIDLTTKIAKRLQEFYDYMVSQADEQQDNLNLELETYGILKDTQDATKSAYAFLDGDERQRLNESLGYIADMNANLSADADMFIRNTEVLVETFKFEDEVKTAQAVEAFDKWLAAKQGGGGANPKSLTSGTSMPISANQAFGSETGDPFGLLTKEKK